MTAHPATPAPAGTTISATLRESTTDNHKRAEQSEFQRLMVSGRLAKPGYVAWLGQMRHVFTTIEAAMAKPALRARFPELSNPGWGKSEHIDADLKFYGGPASVEALSTTRDFQAKLSAWAADGDGVAFFGALYVLEGSTNGARYIAKSLAKAYSLAGHDGLAFQDPYGDEQPQRWQAFKAALDAEIPPAASARVVAAAAETFDAIGAMGEELKGRI